MLSLSEVLSATRGSLLHGGSERFGSVSTDTRSLEPGALFVPLKGPSFDGHDYLAEAASKGATGALIGRDVELPAGMTAIRVDDPLRAYGDLARCWREKLGLEVVAITGSSGKTSTKEAIASLLSAARKVGKTESNYNNEIGVPRTLLSMDASHQTCVLEMGMRGPGEIAYLASVARPDVGVLTNIGTAHIGRLGSQEAIARAKGELLQVGGDAMRAVVNGDDPRTSALGDAHPGPVATFSLKPGATVWAEGEGTRFLARWKAGPRMDEGSAWIEIPRPGDHHRSNALAAVAVAWQLGITLPEEIRFENPELPGRASIRTFKGIELVDETYNANPESMRATILAFTQEAANRRIVVVGEMGELGPYAESAHLELGEFLRNLPVDAVLTVGPLAALAAEQCEGLAFQDTIQVIDWLRAELKPGDRVLIKGSRSARMERIVDALSEAS